MINNKSSTNDIVPQVPFDQIQLIEIYHYAVSKIDNFLMKLNDCFEALKSTFNVSDEYSINIATVNFNGEDLIIITSIDNFINENFDKDIMIILLNNQLFNIDSICKSIDWSINESNNQILIILTF